MKVIGKIAIAVIAIVALLAVPGTVAAQSTELQPSVDMNLEQPAYVLGTAVSTGDLIGIDYKVSVASTSPVSLDGYCMHFTITDPSGNKHSGWACRDTTVAPGQSDSGTIRTGVTADKEGTWTATVTLYDHQKDDQFKTSTITFQVSETQPVVSFTLTDITAYVSSAAMSVFGGALALSSRFRGWITG